jgi:hypothetical protein
MLAVHSYPSLIFKRKAKGLYYKTLRIRNVRKMDKFCCKLVLFEASERELTIAKKIAYYGTE